MARATSTSTSLTTVFWSGAWMIAMAFLCSFFTTMLALTSPMFLLLIYDRVLSARSQETLVALFGLVAILLVLSLLFDYARRRIMARFGARLQDRLELATLRAADAEKTHAEHGWALVSGTKDLDRLRGFFHSGALIAVFDIVWAPIILAAVFLFHPTLGWVACTALAALLILSVLRNVFTTHLDDDAQDASTAMNSLGQRIREARPTLASQSMAHAVVDRWRDTRRNTRDLSIVQFDRDTWFRLGRSQLRLFFQALILAVGASLHLAGELTIGGMVACFILIGRVFLPFESFLKSLPNIRAAADHWRALNDTLRKADLACDHLSAPAMAAHPKGGLCVRDLHPDVGTGLALHFSGVTFSVAPGEVVQISGGIGSGKSILAAALAGRLPLAAGSIAVGGRGIGQFRPDELGQIIGYLPEEVGFFPGTIAQNIARLTVKADEKAVVTAARHAEAHQMILGLSRGYRTRLDHAGAPLSSGERRKIALARALYAQPTVLIADDAAGVLQVNEPHSTKNGPAIVLLTRKPRSLAVRSRHFHLTSGALTPQNDIPARTRGRTAGRPGHARPCTRKEIMTVPYTWSNRKPVLICAFAVALLIGGVGSWSLGVEISGAVLGKGHVQVQSNKVAIQHPTGGVVQAITARNGDFVREGDILLKLDGTHLVTQLRIVEGELIEILAKEARNVAIVEGAHTLTPDPFLARRSADDPVARASLARQERLLAADTRDALRKVDLLTRKIAQVQEQIIAVEAQSAAIEAQARIIRDDLTNAAKMEAQGLVKASHHNAIRRDDARLQGEIGRFSANRAELAEKIIELELERISVLDTRRSAAAEALGKSQPIRTKLIENRADLLTRLDHLVVKAPVTGHVHESRVAGRRSVIEAGKPIMWIVPADQPTVAVVRVDAGDVEQVHRGQDAMLRFTAFNRRATPLVPGKILTVSPDAIVDPVTRSSYYEIQVAFTQADLKSHIGTTALPGMPVEVFFTTDKQTPFEYVTRPLVDYLSHAYRDM